MHGSNTQFAYYFELQMVFVLLPVHVFTLLIPMVNKDDIKHHIPEWCGVESLNK
jgi:hypothetical protein